MRVAATPFSDPQQLVAIDALIAQSPGEIGLLFGRACCLEDLGRIEDAVGAYIEVLRIDAKHFGALTNLGSLLSERGRVNDAKPYVAAAFALYPSDPIALVNAAQMFAVDGDLEDAERTYLAALAAKPGLVHAHLGLARVYEALEAPARAAEQLDAAFAEPKAWHFPYRGDGDPLKVLVLVSAFGGDMVTNLFFDDRVVEKGVLLADSVRGPLPVAPFHVLFNAIGDADRSRSSLERAVRIAESLPATVINHPAAVLQTGRVETMLRMAGIDGVRVPRTERFARAGLTPALLESRGFDFPLLLRSPGHHAGDHFEYVARPHDLVTVLETIPGRDVFAIEWLDARGADGDVRKYRVVAVDGELFPVHLAIAPQWKVHYFSAEMAERPDHRAEEAAYLGDMHVALGARAVAGLREIIARTELDYCGADFGLAADGTVLLFEANATMAVYPPEAGGIDEYRRIAVDRVVAAVRTMLVSRAAQAGYGQ